MSHFEHFTVLLDKHKSKGYHFFINVNFILKDGIEGMTSKSTHSQKRIYITSCTSKSSTNQVYDQKWESSPPLSRTPREKKEATFDGPRVLQNGLPRKGMIMPTNQCMTVVLNLKHSEATTFHLRTFSPIPMLIIVQPHQWMKLCIVVPKQSLFWETRVNAHRVVDWTQQLHGKHSTLKSDDFSA